MEKVASVFTKKQTSIGSAAVVLMGMVLISGVLGLIRWRVLNDRFTPEETGVFLAAFRLPNLLFEILAMGALTSAFIPVFTKYITQRSEQEARLMASTIINLAVLSFIVLSIPLVLFTQSISRFFAPGFTEAQIIQMASFTRLMILFQVVPLLVGNFFTGVLQSYNLFLIPALAPILYNIGLIVGILLFSSMFGLMAPVIGVGIGALLFLLVQVPFMIRIGYRHVFSFSPKVPGVNEVIKLMTPRILGLIVSQIDITVDLMLSSLLGPKMVTVFTLAQTLQQLPVRLFGTTVAQAALPSLSTATAQEDKEQFARSISQSIRMILFFVLPTASLFIVLRIPIVRLIFGASRFDWEATVLTGMTLSAFSVSLFSQAISHILTRGFYALYDSKTPVIVGIGTILLNASLSAWFILVLKLPVWSLAVSTSIASIVNGSILFLLLYKRIPGNFFRETLIPGVKMFLAAGITGIMLYIPLKLLDQLVFDTTRTFGLILLTGVSGVAGLTTYFFLSWVLGVSEVQTFIQFIFKSRKKRVLLEPADVVVDEGVK